MKIDFEMLQKMVDAGASGAVILAMLREQHAKFENRREADRLRKTPGNQRNSSENSGKLRKASGNVRNSAEIKTEKFWNDACLSWAKFGRWPTTHAGPDPESPACECPIEILVKHGIVSPRREMTQ